MIPELNPEDNGIIVRRVDPKPPASGWLWFEDELIDVFLPQIGIEAVAVYCGLACYANNVTQTCWPSVERLARDLGSTPEIIMAALKTLETHGLITMKVRYRARNQYPSYLFTLLSLHELAARQANAAAPSPHTTSSQKLRDPRWQKKRLEVFEQDHWQCQNCGDTLATVPVHHHTYNPGCDPWDYPFESLATLCEPCHEAMTEAKKRLSQRGEQS